MEEKTGAELQGCDGHLCAGGDAGAEEDGTPLCFALPAELWAVVCRYLSTPDLVRLSATCCQLRWHALSEVRSHAPQPLGLVARKSRLREALKFAATLPRLDSLDLSAWDTLSDSVLPYLPQTLQSLDVSYTNVSDRGLALLPTSLTRLNVSTTNATGRGLRYLSRLVHLEELSFRNNANLAAAFIKFIPRTVERLDLSNCSGFSHPWVGLNAATRPWRMAWPPQLKELHLEGYYLVMAHLMGLPSSLTKLDISNCSFFEGQVDLAICLPNLEILCANGTSWGKGAKWNPPPKLKAFSLNRCCADSWAGAINILHRWNMWENEVEGKSAQFMERVQWREVEEDAGSADEYEYQVDVREDELTDEEDEIGSALFMG